MKVLIACDKFKGSIGSLEACQAIAEGLQLARGEVEISLHPMADGGDGSLEILENFLEGFKMIFQSSEDPLGRQILGQYLVHEDAAYIELATCSGIALLGANEKNPLKTSSFGTGRLMKDALEKGYRKIILLLGGSATNDAGIGILNAVGFRFLNKDNEVLFPKGENLNLIEKIELPNELPEFDLTILSDVKNPFCGSLGAAHVFAKQKGANEDEVLYLEKGLVHFADLLKRQFGKEIHELEGAGCAGGIGGGLYGLLNAKISLGFEYLAELSQLEKRIEKADLVITGEGNLDGQSLNGKVIGGIVALCEKHKKALRVIAGGSSLTEEEIKEASIEKIETVMAFAKSKKDAIKYPSKYLKKIGKLILD